MCCVKDRLEPRFQEALVAEPVVEVSDGNDNIIMVGAKSEEAVMHSKNSTSGYTWWVGRRGNKK